jgi:DNA-binding Lrp family transcriptional regulator
VNPPVSLDRTDRRLLQLLQDAFPLDRRPWAVLGDELGIAEEEALARARRLSREGVVRSIGPVVEARRIGLAASTLVGLRLPGPRLVEVARMVGEHPGVSHCYERDHEYNLWFTLAMADAPALEHEVRRLLARARIPPEEVLNPPVRRRFKVDVRYRFAGSMAGGEPA